MLSIPHKCGNNVGDRNCLALLVFNTFYFMLLNKFLANINLVGLYVSTAFSKDYKTNTLHEYVKL